MQVVTQDNDLFYKKDKHNNTLKDENPFQCCVCYNHNNTPYDIGIFYALAT